MAIPFIIFNQSVGTINKEMPDEVETISLKTKYYLLEKQIIDVSIY